MGRRTAPGSAGAILLALEAVLKPLLAKEPTSQFLNWLLETPEAMQAFASQLTPKDAVGKALTVWATNPISERGPPAPTACQRAR